MIHFKNDGYVLALRALADAIKPPVPMAPSVWAAANLIVPDGPRAGQSFDLSLTPYLAEPLDMLGPDSPVNEIAVMKSAQTGFTLLLIALIGHIVDRTPCRVMVVQPTSDAVAEFNREKLDPAIKKSPALRGKVAAQTSRSSEGSTTYSKRFAGGSVTLAIATSAADLRSKTVRVLLRDEIDQYPDDLDGQGDPLEISDGRLIAFLASGDWKKSDISTPTIKGASKIERRYEQGDQRRWHIPCPGCREEFVFEFGPQFRFEATYPHKAYYVAPCCGAVIEPHQKVDLVRKGRWIAAEPRPGAFPSYHIDALSSPFVPWDEVAKAFVAAGDNPTQLKTFSNLWLGRPFEVRGDAPDHVRLMERREDGPPRGHVPSQGLLLVAAADVQMRGIWVEIVAFAPDRQSWTVDAFYCDGSTEAPGSLSDAPDSGNAFSLMLHKTIGREFSDAFGRTRKLDALGIDSGYRSHVVYATVRANQRLHPTNGQEIIYATDGRDGWGKPPIGSPSLADIDFAGHRVRKGCKIWPVGTWPLKGAFYSDLRKEGLRSGAEVDPPGYCHFASWLDEGYFRQLTAEYLAEETYKGRARKFWKIRASQRDNHWLDTRVICMALAEHLGLSSITPAEWAGLAKERGSPAPEALGLFRAAAGAQAAPAASLANVDAAEDDAAAERLERLAKANAGLDVQLGRHRL
jgi:phage terminase large subunit GpA-like protein